MANVLQNDHDFTRFYKMAKSDRTRLPFGAHGARAYFHQSGQSCVISYARKQESRENR